MFCLTGRTRFSVFSIAAICVATLSPANSASDDIQFSILLDTDAPGFDYKRFDPPSFSSCQERCGAEAACRAFSFNVTKRVCFLKNKGNIALVPHSDAIAGKKIAGDQFAISKDQDLPGYDYERFDPPLLAIADAFALENQNARLSATTSQSRFAF